jgi:hypothetical protein
MRHLGFLLVGMSVVALISCSQPQEDNQMPSSYPNDKDGAGLNELAQAGVDLKLPHEVSYYLYLPTEEAAGSVATVVREKGFVVDVRSAALGPGWLCLASHKAVPEYTSLRAIRTEFESLMEKHSGEYDGWEIAVAK